MKWQYDDTQTDKIWSCWNTKLMKYQIEEIPCWWHTMLMKYKVDVMQVDEMPSWWNGKFMQHAKLMKWQVYEMASI
jgi:hypothetical protein